MFPSRHFVRKKIIVQSPCHIIIRFPRFTATAADACEFRTLTTVQICIVILMASSLGKTKHGVHETLIVA